LYWPALGAADGSFQVFVGNHWLSDEGKMITFDDRRRALPCDVNPGESFAVDFVLAAPEGAGKYVLEFDVGQERVTWFKDYGSPTLRVQVEVLASRPLWKWLRGIVTNHPQPIVEMYGTPPQEVADWIEKCGGQVLCVENDQSAGPRWFSKRYWVKRAG
jgi:hypothetical protein